MAVPKFNANLFKAKKESLGNGDFPTVVAGVYICKLEKCYSKVSDKGVLRAHFGWQIDEADPEHPNQYIWANTGLTDEKGVDSEQGYNVLAIILSQLKVHSDSPDLDGILEAAIGTKARISWNPENDKGYSELRIKKLIAMPDGSSQPTTSAYKSEPDTATEAAADEQVVEIHPGMIGIHTTGTRWEVLNVLEADESDDGEQYVFCKPVGGKASQSKNIKLSEFADFQNPEPKGVTQEKVSQPVPSANELDSLPLEEEAIAEEESDGFTVGQNVTGISAKSGKTVTGTYKETDDNGLIAVFSNNTIFRLKPESVKPV